MPKGIPKKPRKVNPFVKIIQNLVDIPKECPPSFWAKESKLAKQLVAKFGEEKMLAYTPISKYPSLAYFMVIDGYGDKIEKNWRMKNIVIPPRETYELGEKIGEDIGISPQNDTIRSWLSEKKPQKKKNKD